MTFGGDGTVGYEFTEEDRAKISSAGKGRTFSNERNEKIRVAMLNRTYKSEWRENLSKSRIGRFTGEENPFFGRHHSEESKIAQAVSKGAKHIIRMSKNGEPLQEYQSIGDAARWVIREGITTAKQHTCMVLIAKVCSGAKGHKSCYGYKWKYM